MIATGKGQFDANGKPVDGNITLTADGLAMLDAERNVTLQAATSGYRETSTSSNKNMQLSTASLPVPGRPVQAKAAPLAQPAPQHRACSPISSPTSPARPMRRSGQSAI